MTNFWEIAGISLQLLAGLFLILDQIAKDRLQAILVWIRDTIAVLSAQPTRRRRILIIIALISLPTVILPVGLVTDWSGITWSTIGGLAIWSLLGYDFYLYSLGACGKRLIKGKVSYKDGLRAAVEQGKLLRYNIVIFTISVLWIVVLGLIYGYVFMNSSQNLAQQSLMAAYIFLSFLSFVPVALMSSIYLIGEFIMGTTRLLSYITRTQFWFAVLVIWLTGGAFLLVNACSK
jgi:hypothetical protein